MNDTYILTTYVVIDDILKAHGFKDDCQASGTAAEILRVGVIAAKYFQNHHERALDLMTRLGYVHGLSTSRFNEKEEQQKIENIKREISKAEKQLASLITNQANADTDIQHIYTKQIVAVTERLKVQTVSLNVAIQQLESQDTVNARNRVFAELVAMGIDNFWKLDTRKINQMLHRLLGDMRFMVRKDENDQAQIVGIGKPIPRR